ncbi:MAG: LmeA family phospholipid-binding protein [Egibacteraceae bacterium]
MRAFVASVMLAAAIMFGLDLALERAAEGRASAQVSQLLGAPTTVDLQGWPVSLRLLSGAASTVEVHAENVPTGSGVRLRQVNATIRDVRLRLGDLSASRLPVDVPPGTFIADLDAEAVRQLLGEFARAGPVRLASGLVLLLTPSARIEARVDAGRGTLVLTPVTASPQMPSPVEIPLPRLPAGTTVQRISVLDGALRLEGIFDPKTLLQTAP